MAWLVAVAAVLPVVLMLRGVSAPGGYHDVLVTALVTWSLVGLTWVVVAVRRLSRVTTPHELRPLWPLLITPLLFVAAGTVAAGDLPGRVVFAQNRVRLEQAAASYSSSAAPQTWRNPQLGPYAFGAVYQLRGCVFFSVADPGMAINSGFAYCPRHDPAGDTWDEGETFQPFDGDWYTYLIRYGSWSNRSEGARPWGLQLSELRSRSDV